MHRPERRSEEIWLASFTEGFDTPDLVDAKLACETSSRVIRIGPHVLLIPVVS
jgi:hypothetical protein